MSRIIKPTEWGEPCVIEVLPPSPAPVSKKKRRHLEDSQGNTPILSGPELEILEDLQKQKADFEAELSAAREKAKLDITKAKSAAEKEIVAAMESTEKAREEMMAECREKKKEADRLLSQAKTDSAVMRADAEQETKAILDDAHEQARHIMEDAQKKGHEQGLGEGREEGIRLVREEQKQTIIDANAKAEKTLEDAKEECRTYIQGAENEIASLALEVVEHILPQHFIDVPQIILPVVRKALMKVKDQSEVHVRVAPDSYDLVLMARSEFQGLLEGQAFLEVHSDEDLSPGDVVIETPNGNVDARLSTQIEMVRQSVQGALKC